MERPLCLTGILLCLTVCACAQKTDSVIDRITQFPNRLFSKIQNKTDRLDAQLTRQTEKYLERLARKENKIRRKLFKTDSNSAKNLFDGAQQKYQQLEQKISTAESGTGKALSGEYMPNIDSLKGSLSFLSQNQKLLSLSPALQGQAAASLASFNQLQSKFQSADEAKEFIRQRKQQLKDALSRYSNSLGLKKYLDEYNKEVYYYSQQVREYKEILNDPEKLEQKALTLLNRLPAFRDFMKNNSQLAGLFNISADYGTAQGLEGLQTRDQVRQLIQGQIGSGGTSGMASIQSSMQSAHQQLDGFKDKLNALGGGSGDMDMPDFKSQTNKTKSFLKRLEYGTNFQTTRSSYFYPTTIDIGLSIGYKISNTNVVGLGWSYKIGIGADIQHIHVTSNGASIRSFVDIKMKKNLFFSGGLEYNYQQPFNSFQQIKNLNQWQQSGLIGVTKLVSIQNKLVKKTKLQLLFDFLSFYQLPRTPAFKFRVGYNF
ncbi:MAG TPA: hypothetical protein VK543_18765 [Puia sp.]|nr:hypothetical protein [Puia sp.]